jgi:16S rRNA G527 N7-methylase RsmG
MIWNNNNKDKLKQYQETFKAKGKVINLTNDENIHLDIEDIYENSEFLTEDEKFEFIENIINNKNI